MKRAIAGIIALSFLMCLATAGLAARTGGGIHEPEVEPTVLGTITAIDAKKGDITVNDEIQHYGIIVHLKTQDRPKVKVGDRVRIKLQRESNIANTVIVENKAK